MEELQSVHEEIAGVNEAGMVKKKRRRRKVSSSRDVEWDRSDKSRHRRRQDPVVMLLFALGLVSFAGALFLVGWFGNPEEGEEEADDAGAGGLHLVLDDGPVEEDGQGQGAQLDPVEQDEKIRSAVRGFLEAPDVEALLETIRNRDTTEQKVREYYRVKPYEAQKFHEISEDGVLGSLGSLVSVNVTLADFTVKPVALEWSGEQFRVDWESWVGYSEIALDEFMERQPLRSRLFRVLSKPVDYYNFAFSDDSMWSCFELLVAGEEESLYGYVAAGSELEKTLTPLDPDAQLATFVVRLRFPEAPQTRNQVLIEKVVASGWVVGEEKP